MDIIQNAYDAAHFRKQGHKLIDLIADHLAGTTSGQPGKVLPWADPEVLLDQWNTESPEYGQNDLAPFFAEVLRQSLNGHHSKDIGHQVTPTAPTAVLGELLGAYINNGSGVYEVSTVTTVLERKIIQRVTKAAGFGAGADGFLTSGGSLGNLTALLAARQAMTDYDAWGESSFNKPRLAFMVSEEAHYSVDRMVRIMGWGSGGLIKVPVDDQFRLRADALKSSYDEAWAAGKQVIGVIGNAGSTATGSFDPLNEIADFCEANSLWFHVDGAHGGALIFSEKHRHVLKGLSRADSFLFDFHKMLLTPALATALIFRKGDHSYNTFSQQASYLWQDQHQQEWFNLAKRTFECTKPILSLKIYSLLHQFGTRLFSETIDTLLKVAKEAAALIQAQPDFELLVFPENNILCYRYVPETGSHDHNQLNSQIRKTMIENGEYYLVQTSVEGKVYLRSAIMNPLTSIRDFEQLLPAIRKTAETIQTR